MELLDVVRLVPVLALTGAAVVGLALAAAVSSWACCDPTDHRAVVLRLGPAVHSQSCLRQEHQMSVPPTAAPIRARVRRADRSATDYSQVLQAVQTAGLMCRRYTYYAIRLALLLLALSGVWVGFAMVGNSWVQLAIAAMLAVVLTQIIFFSHDAAHRQIFRSHQRTS